MPPNQSFGRYVVTRRLGRGGMAEVYEANDPLLNRPVAIKVIYAHLASQDGFDQRFRREAQLVASLRHPHIVQLYDFGIENEQPFMVMEYLNGGTLHDLLLQWRSRGAIMPLDETARLLTKLGSALDYAHERDAIHRDIKSSNIMFTAEGEPVLTDFGIAKILSEVAHLSATGSVMGSPAYMAPEQAMGQPVDARSDLYALGIVLYEMVSGRVPFQADSPTAVMMQHISQPPPPPRQFNPQLPPAAEAVIQKALAKDPAARFNRVSELAAAFQAAVTSSEITLVNALFVRDPAATMVSGEPTAHAATAAPTASRSTPPSQTPAPLPASPPAGRAARGWLLPALAALALIAAVSVFLLLRAGQVSEMGMPTVDLSLVRFSDGAALSDQATATLNGVPAPAPGTQYEVWLLRGDERRQSMGIIPITDGQGTLSFADPNSGILLADFDAVAVTIESAPDNNPMPGATVLWQGQLPAQALMHIGHVLVAREDTPDSIGYAVGLRVQAELLQEAGAAQMAALQAQDLQQVRQIAEGIIGLIEGSAGEHAGDLNGDGVVSNLGDGFGLLPNSTHVGYIQGTLEHASLAGSTPDSTDAIRQHVQHVQVAIQNVSEWVVSLRALSLQIAQTTDLGAVNAAVREAATLTKRILDGQDINGNESVDPIPNEGGVITAYLHAQFMADIILTKP